MEHSKLSDHKFKRGKFITPWNALVKEIGRETSWYYGRLPEYLWLALIINFYGREKGFSKCYRIIKKLHELAPNMIRPKFSEILGLDQEAQSNLYNYILEIIDVCVLNPLTVAFTYSRFPNFASKFYSQLSIDERIDKINAVMTETSDHQSHLSTDIRFVVIYFELLSNKLCMPKESLELILEYPNLSHDDEKMRIIRPTIRSMELVPAEIDSYDEQYLNIFWEEISRMSNCELFRIDFKDAVPDNAQEYMQQVKRILEYYSDLLVAARPLDNKMLVLLGIATYSYKRLLEVVEHELYTSISGRSVIRVLIENYIMMKYLLQNESAHEDIWTEYQYYGIGQYKLIVERFRESGKDLSTSHVLYNYLDCLVSEYKNKEFIDMDTSYFDKQNVREKAISVGEKELFGLYYDYDSAFEHGLWGAIRESSLIKCNCPSHQYHCVPDLDNNQKLNSIWNDCAEVMNKILLVLQDTYGLSAHLMIGVGIDE